MQRAERAASAQIGFSWDTCAFLDYEAPVEGFSQKKAWTMLERGVMYAMMAGSFAPELRELTGMLDKKRPLVVVSPSCMSEAGQRAIIDFVEEGGQALVLPVLPEFDVEGRPLTLLKDFAGLRNFRKVERRDRHIRLEEGDKVFMIDELYTADLPEDARPIAWDDRAGCAVAAEMRRGRGRLVWCGAALEQFNLFSQAVMMERLMARLGGRETVESSNRNIFTALWSDGEHELLFVLNPYSGRQRTNIRIRRADGWQELGEIQLKPMEIYSVDL